MSYVHAALREAMGEYSSSGAHRPPTHRAPNSQTQVRAEPKKRCVQISAVHSPCFCCGGQTSVSFSLPSGAGHVGYFQAESGGRDASTDSQGSALLYTTLNGDARRVSRSLDELKQANLSLTTVRVCRTVSCPTRFRKRKLTSPLSRFLALSRARSPYIFACARAQGLRELQRELEQERLLFESKFSV